MLDGDRQRRGGLRGIGFDGRMGVVRERGRGVKGDGRTRECGGKAEKALDDGQHIAAEAMIEAPKITGCAMKAVDFARQRKGVIFPVYWRTYPLKQGKNATNWQ